MGAKCSEKVGFVISQAALRQIEMQFCCTLWLVQT